MSRPNTCGAAGGAISLWMRVINCSESFCGVVTTRSQYNSGGFAIYYTYHPYPLLVKVQTVESTKNHFIRSFSEDCFNETVSIF